MTPVPLLPGLHPDPSITRTTDGYVMVTSTFEYLPGIPVYRSEDLDDWTLVGHVADRPGQLAVGDAPTGGGVWAPTVRCRDGVLYVVVTDTYGRGNLLFTAADPAGPWSDGLPIDVDGIDPDLAWDDDGTCYLTFSGFQVHSGFGHLGIQQVRVDLTTGEVLEAPRSLWSGSGLKFPEAPHLYRIDDWWYLLIAEGGTERGHSVSVARSTSPTGPFEGCPANPVLTASGSSRPVQATGHGDLVERPGGGWAMTLLGTWTAGISNAFAPLGRETFLAEVTWEDGWPLPAPVDATVRTTVPPFVDELTADRLGPGWVAVRRFPDEVARIEDGALVLDGDGRSMDDLTPTFVGRRPTRLDARIAARVRAGTDDTVGGISLRYDERHHYDLELQPGRAVARAVLPTILQEHEVLVADGPVELAFEIRPAAVGLLSMASCDLIDLVVTTPDSRQVVATFDGRYLSVESTCSFAGRVAGVYCQTGRLHVDRFEEIDRPDHEPPALG